MKAAYANGVLSAFEEAGHCPFDAVYGTSAGGALGAWFAAGQARHAEATWAYAADERLLSYRRWITGRGVLLDHEALLDIVYVHEHPLDQAAVLRSPFPVIVTAADVHSGEVAYHDLRDGDIIPWLKATGRLPFACGPPVVINGRAYLDGGIVDPIPVRKAVEDGATEITLILNRVVGGYRPDNRLIAKLAALKFPRLGKGILEHQKVKDAAMDFARNPHGGVVVNTIRPAVATGLTRLSRDQRLIRAGIELGRRDGWAHLQAMQGQAALAT